MVKGKGMASSPSLMDPEPMSRVILPRYGDGALPTTTTNYYYYYYYYDYQYYYYYYYYPCSTNPLLALPVLSTYLPIT